MRACFPVLLLPLLIMAVVSGAEEAEDSGPELAGFITSSKLSEISGMAVSRRVADRYWVHNDSGGRPEITAVDGKGALLDTVTLTGAKNVDWEDMASGVTPGGQARLWIADTGNNLGLRRGGTIYRLAEPMPGTKKAAVEALSFRWPEGARDCECLLADAAGGTGLLLTKRWGDKPGEVYAFPLLAPADQTMTLRRVAGAADRLLLQLTALTAGSVSPDGARVIIRTYGEAWLWKREKGADITKLFERSPTRVPLPPVLQGESIAFTADGRAVLTTSERIPAPLYRVPLPSR